jgi:transcriptional regulator with XRE-family HTH domain
MNTIQRLYELMRERNLSLNKLANLSGIKYSTLQMAVKRGGQLSIDTIERICAGLDIPLVSFFDVAEVQRISENVKIVADKPLTSDEIKELRLLLAERHEEK